MPTINDGELNLYIEGVDEETLRRAFPAARDVLDRSGMTLAEAFVADFAREGFMLDGGACYPTMIDAAIEAARQAAGMAEDDPRSVELAIQHAFEEAERRLDEWNIRHLNPDRSPHHVLERAA